jgi:hypothetical protein
MVLRGRIYNQDGTPGNKIYGVIGGRPSDQRVQFPRRNLTKTYTYSLNRPLTPGYNNNNRQRSQSPRRSPRFLEGQQRRIANRQRTWDQRESPQMNRNRRNNEAQIKRETNEISYDYDDQYDEIEEITDEIDQLEINDQQYEDYQDEIDEIYQDNDDIEYEYNLQDFQ